MPPEDPLDREIQETGARSLLEQLANKRAAILAKYPHLAALQAETPQARIGVNNATRYAKDLVALARAGARHLVKKKRHKQIRARYDAEFKAAAVARINAGEWLVDVSQSEGVVPSVLRSWCEAAGVPILAMPWDERTRRMRAGKKGLPTAPTTKLLAETSIAHAKNAKATELSGSQRNSIRIGLNVLSGMPDNEDIHYLTLGRKIGVKDKNIYWHLRKRKEAGHVKLIGKGFYRKTPKGRKYQEETPVP